MNVFAGEILDLSTNFYSFESVVDTSVNNLTIEINSLSGEVYSNLTIRPSYDYWVSPNGDDSNTGSQTQPFLTIQNAINVANTATYNDGITRCVHITYGSYSENLSISYPITLLGETPSRYVNFENQIDGTISINLLSGTDINNNSVSIFNLLIGGKITDSTQYTHTLNIKNCYIYASSCLWQNSIQSLDHRTYIENCVFNGKHNTDVAPIIELSCGATYLLNNDLTGRGDAQYVLLLDGNSQLWQCNSCLFENDSSSATVSPIIYISSSNSTNPFVFNNCLISYTSTTSKSADSPNFSCGIYLSTGNILSIANSSFSLFGTSGGQNCINYNTADTPLPYIFYNNVFSSGSNAGHYASSIQGTINVNKFAFDVVS